MEVNASGRGGAFEPARLEVAVGTKVVWVNNSGNIHNVTFEDSSIKSSSVMNSGERFETTFTRPGSYVYHCTFHPGMDGTVVVR